jgi:hypothetical protein
MELNQPPRKKGGKMNGNPNKKQQDWHNWLREDGCQITGYSHPTIQHIKGARMKLKGVSGLAGEWYCYSLCFEYHLGNRPNSLAKSKTKFRSSFGSEKSIWDKAVKKYEDQFGHKPMSEEEYQIIKDRA